jgi:hypothetical protein
LWSAAALLLAAPLVAMQFTPEVQWTGSDFLFAAIVIAVVGGAAEAAVRMNRDPFYRAGAGFAIAASFMIVWSSAAVGMIGDGDNLYTGLFLGTIGLALGGSAVARFRPGGMAAATAVAGVAQLGVAGAGYTADPRGAAISAVLAGLWFVSAACFRAAARR